MSISPLVPSESELIASLTFWAEFWLPVPNSSIATLALSTLSLKLLSLSTVSFGTSTWPKYLIRSLALSTSFVTPIIAPAKPTVPKAAIPAGPIPARMGDNPLRLPERPAPPTPIAPEASIAPVSIPFKARVPAPFFPKLNSKSTTPLPLPVTSSSALDAG